MDLQEALDVAKRLAETVVRDEAENCDLEAVWPERSFRAVQKRGLAGLVVPKEAGGLGLGLGAIADVCKIFGRESASFAISFGMHCVGSAVIAAKATPAQVEEYLKPIARGEHLTTLALSEPGTGAHFYYPQAKIKKADSGFVLTGQKSFITNGSHVDSYVISATQRDETQDSGMFSCVLVKEGSAGMEWQDQYAGFGMRGNSARSLKLDAVPLNDGDILGDLGDQIWYVFKVVAPFFLVAMAGTYMGIAERAVEEATQHLKGRSYEHDGKRLADSPVLQHRLGSLWSEVRRTGAFVSWATREAEDGGPEALPALCAAKAEVGDCAVHVVNEVMTLVGGKGYAANGILPRMLRDARAAHVMAPTTDLLRIWTGRALLEIPLLGDT